MGHGGIAYLPFGREAQRARSDRRYSSSSRPAQDRERPRPGPCGTRAPVTRSSPLSRPSFGNGQAARGRAHATCAPTVASPSTASAASTRRAASLRARWWSWTSGPPAAELPAGRARDRARLPRSGGRRQARRNAKRSRSPGTMRGGAVGSPRGTRITRTVGLSVTKAMIRMSDSRAREGRQRHVRRARSRRALHRRVDLALPDPARDARRAAALMAGWSEPPRTAPVSSNPEEIVGLRLRFPSLQGLDRRSAS